MTIGCRCGCKTFPIKECQVYGETTLPSHQESSEVAQPGERPLDLPAAPITAQRATVLSRRFRPVTPDAARSARAAVSPGARATDHCRKPCRHSRARASCCQVESSHRVVSHVNPIGPSCNSRPDDGLSLPLDQRRRGFTPLALASRPTGGATSRDLRPPP